jgi:hypothetical protein
LQSSYVRSDHPSRRVLAEKARAAGQAHALAIARLVVAVEVALMLAAQAARFGASRMSASGLQLLPADIGDLLLGDLDSGGVGRAGQEPEGGKGGNDDDRSQRGDPPPRRMVPPGVLLNRPRGEGFLQSAWIKTVLRPGPIMPSIKGLKSFASPVLNSQNFCRFLAKIGHGFAIYALGVNGFRPLLTDFIRFGSPDGWCHYVGGALVPPTEKSKNLHELSLSNWEFAGRKFVVVSIRLFANLGSPGYLVTAGHLQ